MFGTVWIEKLSEYFKVNVIKRNLKNYLHLYLAVTSETAFSRSDTILYIYTELLL